MSRSLLFWGLMIAWILLGLFTYWPSTVVGFTSFMPLGGNLLLWVLLALLGWKVFGPILRE